MPGGRARAASTALDAWHAAAATSNEEAYFALFDDDGVFVGTDVTERWDKAAFRAYAHEPFSRSRGWRFKSMRRDLEVSSDGELAFFDEDLTSPTFAPARGSGVLVRRAAGWKVLRYVLSVTIPNDRLDVVTAAATTKVALSPEGRLAHLGWLAGTWAGTRAAPGDDRGEELAVELTWSQARGGTLVGTLRVATATKGERPGETQSIDALRIESSDKGATYTAERKGRAALVFALRAPLSPKPPPSPSTSRSEAVFVDDPNQVKLTFSVEGDSLLIRVERKGNVEETTMLQRAVIVSP